MTTAAIPLSARMQTRFILLAPLEQKHGKAENENRASRKCYNDEFHSSDSLMHELFKFARDVKT
jgi:hypothetical protein